MGKPKNLLDVLMRSSDDDLLVLLPFIRVDGEKVSLFELKHFLREERRKIVLEQGKGIDTGTSQSASS